MCPAMTIKPGDKVRFLSSSGGGIVTRVIRPGIVAVEIEDGFEIPTAINDLVKIEETSPAARFFADNDPFLSQKDNESKTEPAVSPPFKSEQNASPLNESYIEKLPASRKSTINPEGIYLAFEPHDQNLFIIGYLDLCIVNFSSYDVLYTFSHKSPKGGYVGRDYGSIPPYSKVIIDIIQREELEYVANGIIQLLFTKDIMPSLWFPVTGSFRIKPVRFTKEDNYKSYGFLQRRAFVHLITDLKGLKPVGSLEELQKYEEDAPMIITSKAAESESFITPHNVSHGEAIVDLHIEAIAEDYKTLLPDQILDIQLAYFTRCMETAILDKYFKVTFIHGVGNGVLKNALREKLKDYSNVYFQPAPFARFGMGAIEVMIMHTRE